MSRRADFLPPGGSISIPGSMRQLMKKGKEKGKAALGGHGKSWGGGAGVVGCPTPGEGVLSGLLSPVLCTWLLWTVLRAGSAWPLKYLLCITPSLRPCAALRVATGPPSLLLHLASRWGGGALNVPVQLGMAWISNVRIIIIPLLSFGNRVSFSPARFMSCIRTEAGG